MIHKNRGNRRRTGDIKAKRKQHIYQEIYGVEGPAFGYFRKGKIHCSCAMCSAKTNDSINKSKGPVDGSLRSSSGGRMTVTHMRYGKKNWKISDKRKIDALMCKESE